MRKFVILSVALIALLMAVIGPASAETVLAEYNIFADTGGWAAAQFLHLTVSGNIYDTVMAETFIATASGTVSSIQVDVTRTTTSATPLIWSIRNTHQTVDNGLQPVWTTTGLLSTGSLANSAVPTSLTGWTNVQMTPCELVAGVQYAIVASAVGTNDVYRWWDKNGAVGYSGRHLSGWYYNPQKDLGSSSGDVGFRVLGAVPEPSSIMALLSGVAGLVGFARRRA